MFFGPPYSFALTLRKLWEIARTVKNILHFWQEADIVENVLFRSISYLPKAIVYFELFSEIAPCDNREDQVQ